MAQELKPFEVKDFSGGLVTNASDETLANNEFKDTRNFDIDEKGRLIRRRGFRQCGQTLTGEQLVGSTYWQFITLGTGGYGRHILVNEEADGDGSVYRLVTTYLTADAASGATSLSVGSNADFTVTTGTIEVNGDLITYTATPNATTFTVTGATVARAHPTGSLVNQFINISANRTTTTTRDGVSFAFLGNEGFIDSRGRDDLYDGTNVTAVSDTDAPSGLFSVNYRNRIYSAGGAEANANYTRNGTPIRVSFSSAGDADVWDINDYFDVEDEEGGPITALEELNDRLGVFKVNSIWTYDETELKRRLRGVGAYNNEVVQKIGNLIYTVSPTGIWETNLFSARLISDPIELYLKGFRPQYGDSGDFGRRVKNLSAGVFENKYILYIGDITEPETLSDVALVFDTLRRKWTVYTDFPSLIHLMSTKSWGHGAFVGGTGAFNIQSKEALFGGDDGGKYYRFFDNRFLDSAATRVARGEDFTEDISSETRLPIQAVLETKFYDLNSSGTWKDFGYLKLKIERGDFHVAYRLDVGGGQYTDWISLGDFKKSRSRKRIRDKDGGGQQGYRISLRISTNTADIRPILNGFLFEEVKILNEGYAREGERE